MLGGVFILCLFLLAAARLAGLGLPAPALVLLGRRVLALLFGVAHRHDSLLVVVAVVVVVRVSGLVGE